MVNKAEAAGAMMPHPASDYGFMYQHSFTDLDGHHWGFMWMDPNGMPGHRGNKLNLMSYRYRLSP